MTQLWILLAFTANHNISPVTGLPTYQTQPIGTFASLAACEREKRHLELSKNPMERTDQVKVLLTCDKVT